MRKQVALVLFLAGLLLPVHATAQRDIACSITATPSRAAPGEQVTLRWNSQNARSATLTGYGPVPLQGSRVIQATQTTDYKILVSGYENNYVGCIARISVVAKQPTCQISLVPFAVASNSFATLSWSTDYADAVYISGIGNVQPKGNTMVRATGNTTYTVSARGAGGTCERSTTLSVTNPYSAYGYFPSTIQSVTYPLFGYSTQSSQPTYSYQPRYSDSAYETYGTYESYDTWKSGDGYTYDDTWYTSDDSYYKNNVGDPWQNEYDDKTWDSGYEYKNESWETENYWQDPSPAVGDCWGDVCSI